MASKRIKALITLSIIQINIISACSCNWGGNFLRVEKHSELTIIGKVIKQNAYDIKYKKAKVEELTLEVYRNSIEIEIIKILKGKEDRTIVEIFGSNGADCIESVSHFEIGRSYLFSLNIFSEPYESKIEGLIFNMFGCYESWLNYDPLKEEVVGWLKGKKRKKKRHLELRRLIQKLY